MPDPVYLVEDDKALSDGLTLLLEDEGYEVTAFPDATALPKAVRKRKPRLLILDYRLPGTDGITAAARVRSNPDFHSVPVLIISATHEDLSGRLKKHRIDAFLPKPFPIDTFIATVTMLTGRR